MKVKLLFAFTLFTTLAFGSALKVRPVVRYSRLEKRTDKEEEHQKDDTQIAATTKAEDIAVDESSAPANQERKKAPRKDVHKRGIFYNGGLSYGPHAAHAIQTSSWPKSYAAHHGWPDALAFSNVAAHAHSSPLYAHSSTFAHAPTYFKYPSATGLHFKHFAASTAAIPVSAHGGHSTFGVGNTAIALGAASTVPAYATPAVATLPHAHGGTAAIPVSAHGGHSTFGVGNTAIALGAASTVPAYATPAVATLPHAHGGTFAHPVGAVAPAVATTAPFSSYVLRPGGAVVSSYNVNYPRFHQKPLVTVPHVTPAQPVAHVHPLQTVPAVAAVQPVQPVHSVVQVQHPHHQFASGQPLYHLPHYFQTEFEQPQRVPVAVPAVSLSPSFPPAPTFQSAPTFPAIPTFPTAPAIPDIPTAPAIPTAPVVLDTPTVSIPTQPASSSNPNFIFPVGVQPPTRPQQSPTFVSIPLLPEAQFPPLSPLPGSHKPEGGSAVASPQIPNTQPVHASHTPQPELPAFQGNEEPWKPMFSYSPSSVNRPALTLLPPHGSSGGNFVSPPGEAYLPPATSLHQQQYQQQHQSGLFDNLSDSEIEHIFAQAANLAAQDTPHRQQHHHKLSRY